MMRRRKIVNVLPEHHVGQRKPGVIHGGGGPENAGARTNMVRTRQGNPPWNWEDNSYLGPAARSTTPDLSGIPANNFRGLGDNHGGRQ